MAPAVRRRPATPPEDSSSWEASPRRRGSPLKRVVHVASLVGVRTPPTTRSATQRLLLPVAAVAATTPDAARAATPSSSIFATTPPSGCGVITRAATKARMREVESAKGPPPGFCVATLARYIYFLEKEVERQVTHAKKLTDAMDGGEAAAATRNAEIYVESRRFEEGRLERRRAALAGNGHISANSSAGSSSSCSY